MKASLLYVLLVLLATCYFAEGSGQNSCVAYSCGCCCSQDTKPCCNTGYKGGSLLAYNDGFALDPEEEAIETLGLVQASSSKATNNEDDDILNCKISCADTYKQYKGQIHSILGFRGSVDCKIPINQRGGYVSHQWTSKVAVGSRTSSKKCFTIFDLAGVNSGDRKIYLKQITNACFQKEDVQCNDPDTTESSGVGTRSIDTAAVAYMTYYIKSLSNFS